MVYATTMNPTYVQTRLHQRQPAYRSINIQSWLAAISNLSYTQFKSLHALVYRSRLNIINHIYIFHFKPFDPNLSLDLVLHQPVRSLHSSNQAMHHQPITYILDLILHQIFKTFSITLCLMIFFSFYSLRPFTIPWSKTIVTQYHRLNTWDQHICRDTMVQNHRFKYQGLTATDQR